MSVEMHDEKRDQQDRDRREMVHSFRIVETFEYWKKRYNNESGSASRSDRMYIYIYLKNESLNDLSKISINMIAVEETRDMIEKPIRWASKSFVLFFAVRIERLCV